MLIKSLLRVFWSHVSVTAALRMDLVDTVALSSSILLPTDRKLERRFEGSLVQEFDSQSSLRWLFVPVLPLQMRTDSASHRLCLSSWYKSFSTCNSLRVKYFLISHRDGLLSLSLPALFNNSDFLTWFVFIIYGRISLASILPIQCIDLMTSLFCRTILWHISLNITLSCSIFSWIEPSFSATFEIISIYFISSRASLKLDVLMGNTPSSELALIWKAKFSSCCVNLSSRLLKRCPTSGQNKLRRELTLALVS